MSNSSHTAIHGAEYFVRVPIRHDADVAMARKCVRELAAQIGLSKSAIHSLAIAVSEVARNIEMHAGVGELTMSVAHANGRRGLVVVGRDAGPGIVDVERAMQDGYSTANSLGLGLSSARRLVDDFEVASTAGLGTSVTLKKWLS